MSPQKPTVTFEVEWSSEAWAELRMLPASERRPVMDAAIGLAGADRNPVKADARTILEAAIPGGHRLLYRVAGPRLSSSSRPEDLRPRVQILCALVEGASGAAVVRPGAGELRRRGATLRKLGGGIPHEVVRRAWLAELRRREA
jgi:hypothetical protein